MILVNPVINDGSGTTISSGTVREGVTVSSPGVQSVTTDAEGVAIIKNLPVGEAVPLKFSSGDVFINIVQEKELYDVVVSYNENGVQEIIEEVRYQIGGDVIVITPDMDNAAINAAIKGPGKVVYFTEGTYIGDIALTDRNVLIFGSYDEENSEFTSVIKGNINVSSEGVRLRGLIVTDNEDTADVVEGDIKLTGGDFSAAYCEFHNASMPGNMITLIHNTFSGTASVTGNNVVLLDNVGL